VSGIGAIYDALVARCGAIIYPDGATTSVTGRNTIIKRGWLLSTDMLGPDSVKKNNDYITISLEKGHFEELPSPIGEQWSVGLMTLPTIMASVSAGVLTVSSVAEGVASGVIGVEIGQSRGNGASDAFYAYEVQPSDTPVDVIAALAAQIQGSVVSDASLRVDGADIISVRLSGSADMRRILRRQRQRFCVTVWTDRMDVRDALSDILDVGLSKDQWLQTGDGISALMIYRGAVDGDGMQAQSVFRRDLSYDIAFETVESQTGRQMIGFGGVLQEGSSARVQGETFASP